MSSEFLYARYHPSGTRVHVCSRDGYSGRALVFDLAGEIRAPLLRDRLLALDVSGRFDHVILRGASDFLGGEIDDESGGLELAEHFPGARLWRLEVDQYPTLVPLKDTQDSADQSLSTALLAWCGQAEIEAALVWHNAIWHDRSYHFVLPSGYHADKFVRIGDIFVDPLNVSRAADWCGALCTPPCVLMADSFTLLPLLQELELRMLRRILAASDERWAPDRWISERGAIPKYIVPLYGVPEDEVRERLAEVVPVARDAGASISAFVSVFASGGYVTALADGLRTFARPPLLRVLALCAAGPNPGPAAVDDRLLGLISEDKATTCVGTSSLGATSSSQLATPTICRLPALSFRDQESCQLCRDGSATVEIDQQRFTTRLGVRVLEMPKPPAIEESTLMIREADACGALRLHVNRPDRHGHLAIYVDTGRLLDSRVFRAKATIARARVCSGFAPDLVLAPAHDGTTAVSRWLASEGMPNAVEVATELPLSEDVEQAIRTAHAILLVDDAVITGRTLHALIEHVQRVKGGVEDGAFELRGMVLVARPANSSTWKRLRDRFHIRGQHGLHAPWELNLPDVGINGREACPWCVERRFLVNVLPTLTDSARAYVERRLERLADPNGLTSAIYLGAECALDESGDGWNPAVHTTPGSYLGNVTDVGAFVGAAALLQSMRDEWNRSRDRWSMRYAMPIATALGRYTDPVIVAGLLRGVSAPELWGEPERDLARALVALDHTAQHGVLAAEILLAAHQRKLPRGTATDLFRQRLRTLPPAIAVAIAEIFRGRRLESSSSESTLVGGQPHSDA